jgi:mannose-1-phosphate guanylyltransferase/phosphomannomutase
MIAHVVELLARHGFDDVIVTVAYLGNAIRSYLGDGSDFGIRIRYLQEETPLGTAGAVANARSLLRDTFVVLSGDVVTDIDISQAVAYHKDHGGLATMVLTRVDSPIEFGIVALDEAGQIDQLIEKPSWGEVFTDTVNTGIYVLEPEVLEQIPAGRAVDFSEEVFPRILESNRGQLYGYVASGYWADVGTFQGYLQTHRDILNGKVGITVNGFKLGNSVTIGNNCQMDPTVSVMGPALIGDHVRMGPHVQILPYSVIGDNVRIGAEAVVDGGIVLDNGFIGEQVQLRTAIVGRGCDIRKRAVINDQVVLGDSVFVGRDAVIHPEVKVYPAKTVEPMATVHSSIVWETGASRTVFGPLGISGLANIDINPELATRIAMAFASLLPPHASVTAARDTSRAARVIKRAMMVGFNSVGLDVLDLEATTMPVVRHMVATGESVAGFRVFLDPDDPQSLVIHLLGEDGQDLSASFRRKIERALEREDFRRVTASEIGDLMIQSRSLDSWKTDLASVVPLEKVPRRRFKMVIDYSYGLASITVPQAISGLHLDLLALNAYAATEAAIAISHDKQMLKVAELVVGSTADLGVVVDVAGEKIHLVDDRGGIIPDVELAHILISLVARLKMATRVVAPVNMPPSIAEIAEACGLKMEWSALGSSEVAKLTRASSESSIGLTDDGALVYSPAASTPDVVISLEILLAGLAERDARLSELRRSVPTYQVAADEVPVPYALMGHTMRQLRSFAEARYRDSLTTIDGVRVEGTDWFWLVAPDHQEPLVRLWVGAKTDQDAAERLSELKMKVAVMRDSA